MSEIKAINSVYAYFYPEVREVVNKVVKGFSQELLLKSIFPGLDNYHDSFITKFVKKSEKYQKGLADFENKYFINGSSEGIFHLLVDSIFHNEGKPIYIFKGDYEGYQEYAKNIGGSVINIDFTSDFKKLPLGRWFISNPSAIDGNILDNKIINLLCDLGHEVIVDISYLGSTKEYQLDLTHPNIIAVLASMSKPFGLFYYRIGIVFSRRQLPTLYPNKWFKNILSISIAEALLDKFGIGHFYKKYQPVQEKAIKQLKQETGFEVIPSDILLLAYAPSNGLSSSQKESLSKFLRGDNFRFCLTPYFLNIESNKKPEG
jgi:histidinol-phosphate/aromatic aminotransferase/cobyric acid decarboxylase-like protein